MLSNIKKRKEEEKYDLSPHCLVLVCPEDLAVQFD